MPCLKQDTFVEVTEQGIKGSTDNGVHKLCTSSFMISDRLFENLSLKGSILDIHMSVPMSTMQDTGDGLLSSCVELVINFDK